MKEALRSKDSLRLNTIRSVIAAIKNQEIDLRKELQGDEVLSIVTREVKKRKEASALFEQGGTYGFGGKRKSGAYYSAGLFAGAGL